MPVDWNAEVYHRISEPQLKWGLAVLDSLTLKGDETVLDAGCGSGRLTAHLLERLPQGRVVALDLSEQMLEVARRNLAAFGPRVELQQADLLQLPARFDHAFDVVFSTATFHWVLDHRALFQGLARVLKPSGRLRAQYGGEGNLAGFLALVRELSQDPDYERFLEGFVYPARFFGVAETEDALLAAGFHQVKAWLTPAPTPFATAEDFVTFTSQVVLRHVLALLPEHLRPGFAARAAELSRRSAHPLTLDYVRLDVACSL